MMIKSIAILGAGESGVGAALLGLKQGAKVFVSDFGRMDEDVRQELSASSIDFEEGGHTFEKIVTYDYVVKSPGIPEKSDIIQKLRAAGKKIISEIEYASIFYRGIVIAVTGSNGKTTTSGLMYHVLKNAGYDVALGGNYGKSFARIVAERDYTYMVLEVSSFQLDDIDAFRPEIAVLLNITPDHLDRYGYNMANYVDAKFKITKNQLAEDYFIYNIDDEEIKNKLNSLQLKSECYAINAGQYLNGIYSTDDDSRFELSIKGRHNLLNGMCVVAACRRLGLNERDIADGLSTFVNLPHRLETCGIIEGVEFINDSKATNVDSVYYALDAMEQPIVWIAGGTDKGNDYEVLLPLINEKVKALICLGVDNEKLKTFFQPHISKIVETTKVSEAVEWGLRFSQKGDLVLLSPACASFDLFKNYMDRGNQFKAAVAELSIKNQ